MFEKITYGPLNFWKFHFDPMRVGKLNLSIYYVHGGVLYGNWIKIA